MMVMMEMMEMTHQSNTFKKLQKYFSQAQNMYV